MEITPAEAYLVGYVLGDGTIRQYSGPRLYGQERDEPRVRAAVHKLGWPYTLSWDERRPTRLFSLQLKASQNSFWLALGLNHTIRDLDKFIPEQLKGRDDTALLEGLWDSDGHVGCPYQGGGWRAQIRYTTVSDRLAQDVQQELLHHGMESTLHRSNPKNRKPRTDVILLASGAKRFTRTIKLQSHKQQVLEDMKSKVRFRH